MYLSASCQSKGSGRQPFVTVNEAFSCSVLFEAHLLEAHLLDSSCRLLFAWASGLHAALTHAFGPVITSVAVIECLLSVRSAEG
jgi:hypothetical protein